MTHTLVYDYEFTRNKVECTDDQLDGVLDAVQAMKVKFREQGEYQDPQTEIITQVAQGVMLHVYCLPKP